MDLPELGTTVIHTVRDAIYVTVGLGVIGVANLRDLVDRPAVDTAALTSAVDALNERLDTVVGGLDERVATIEAKVDAVLDQVEDGLPEPAREVMANARGAAKE